MSEQLKPCLLADVEWLHLGSTHEYKDVKKFIADICYDVARAACIDEICINDICVGFRQRGYEVIAKCDLDALRAELAAAQAEIERLRGIIRGTEWVLSADEYDPSKETIVVQYECAICHFVYLDSPGEHAEHCPFYQWEGGAQ